MSVSFKQRALSAAVMFGVALSALWAGHPYFDLFILASGLAMAWEWDGLCGAGTFRKPSGRVLMAAVAAAVILMMVGQGWAALAVLAVATPLVAFLAPKARKLTALGPFYIGLPCLALQELRGTGEPGLMLTLWVLTLVWATDIGGYVFGKTIGGAKLAPRVSPNKTWAGFIGGTVSAMSIGALVAMAADYSSIWLLALGAGLLAVAAQAGDLFESGVKRRFNVKDSSHLIPGHGGVLDRVDGLMIAAPLVALASWLV